jgi:hypothetical protein
MHSHFKQFMPTHLCLYVMRLGLQLDTRNGSRVLLLLLLLCWVSLHLC